MLELRLLQSFVAVAEELHFGRAARRLAISQPPLSAQIMRLEEELGGRLFERGSRHVSLTEAGQALLGRARALLAEAERTRAIVQRVAASDAGTLAVGYTPTATYEVLPPLVRRLRQRHPDLVLELRELTSARQVDALRSGRIEVGFLCLPVASLADDLAVATLARESLAVVLPRGHALAATPRVHVRALRGEPFVSVSGDVEPGWAEAATTALAAAGVVPEVAQVADTKLAMLGLVAAGLGVSVVSRSMACLGRHGVVFRPLIGTRTRLELALATLAAPSPRAATLVALARELASA